MDKNEKTVDRNAFIYLFIFCSHPFWENLNCESNSEPLRWNKVINGKTLVSTCERVQNLFFFCERVYSGSRKT